MVLRTRTTPTKQSEVESELWCSLTVDGGWYPLIGDQGIVSVVTSMDIKRYYNGYIRIF